MSLGDRARNLTPRQRIAAGVVAVCCGLAAPVVTLWEGRILRSYPDPVLGWRVPTACVGSTRDIKPDQTFTEAECDELLKADLRDTYDGMLKCIGDVPLPDHELAAYLSLAFNVGPSRFCQSSIPGKLKSNDHAAACATISLYRFVGGKDCALPEFSRVCGGIVRRRAAERALCEGSTS